MRMSVIGAVLVLAAACGGAERLTPTETAAAAPAELWYTAEQNDALRAMVRLLAEGLADPKAREALLQALQASPLTEHKVELASFVKSPEGQAVLRTAQQRLSTSGADVARIAAQLPPIDLYVPAGQHRMSWRATESIAVAALFDEATPLTAYLPGGQELSIDRTNATPTKAAVLVLGPAEYKTVRPNASAMVGELATIEAATSVTPADAMCFEDSCSGTGGGDGGGGPAAGPAQLRLGLIATWNLCDNNFCWENNEFEFRSRDGVTGLSRTLRCTNVPATGATSGGVACYSNTVVNDAAPSEVGAVDVQVWETDFLPSDDYWADFITPIPPYGYSEPLVAEGHAFFRLWQYPTGFNCAPPNPAGSLYCPRVDVRFTW